MGLTEWFNEQWDIFVAGDWKIALGVLGAILFLFFVYGVFSKRKKKCKHKWIIGNTFLIKNKIRAVKICDICGLAMHIPVYSKTELKEKGKI